ncbi:MAG: hypothetical protein [Caudoviricetes sp.]|nr:MAG: hypothetical protein [Caudoviricetes sp.]
MDYSLFILGIVSFVIGYFLSKVIERAWLSYKNALTSKKQVSHENNNQT